MLGSRAAWGSSSSITVYPRAAPTLQQGVPAGAYPRPEQATRSSPTGALCRQTKEVSLSQQPPPIT
jgi:hypothetical protein